jgi:DNA-binding MarR family transcriptional regulator
MYLGFDDVSFYDIWQSGSCLCIHMGRCRLELECPKWMLRFGPTQKPTHRSTVGASTRGQVLATLFYVATHDDCHKQALEEDLDFTAASGSRNTDWLSNKHRLGKPGLGLITKSVDPSNRRRTTLKLTPKGELLMDQLRGILYGS